MRRRHLLLGALAAPVLGFGALASSAARGAAAMSLGPIEAAREWLGDRPAPATLRGKVVLVDVFTFECINCVRVTPKLKALYARYPRDRFEIVAVHTPEVPSYQGRLAYLAAQRRAAALPWPIAVDGRDDEVAAAVRRFM